jgi:hypothetical protein
VPGGQACRDAQDAPLAAGDSQAVPPEVGERIMNDT